MTQTEWKPRTQGILEILPEEISDFETQVARFRAGEWSENDFMAFRLRQGVYGQRQMDAQMFRIKCPFGGLNADQMDALGVLADEYAPLKKGHVTTRGELPVPPHQARRRARNYAAHRRRRVEHA